MNDEVKQFASTTSNSLIDAAKDTVIDFSETGDVTLTDKAEDGTEKVTEFKGNNPTKGFDSEDSAEIAAFGKTKINGKDVESSPSSRPRPDDKEETPKVKVAEKPTESPTEEPVESVTEKKDIFAAEDTETFLSKVKEQKTLTPGQQRAEKRDYSSFPPEWVPHLKQTAPSAFELFKKLYEEKQTFEKAAKEFEPATKLPKAWHEHPSAYQLSPEYQEIDYNLRRVQLEQEHYKSMLARVRKGEAFVTITDSSDLANVKYSAPQEASDGAADQLLLALQNVNSAGQGFASQRTAIAQNYSQHYQKEVAYVFDIVKKNFPKVVSGEDKIGIETLSEFKEAVPSSFRDHPMTVAAGLLFYDNQRLRNALADLGTQNGKTKTLQDKVARAEPSFSTPAQEDTPAKFTPLRGAKFLDKPVLDLEGM